MRVPVALLSLTLSWSAVSAGVLDEPAFTARPAALLAAARPAAATDASVVVLRDDVTVTLDDRGRATRRYRVVALINQAAAADDWSTLYVGWSPFYQDKPQIRARVITPDGKVAELDATLIQDNPAESDSPTRASERRVVEAPLPRLSAGAIFEEEFVIADREPLLEAGVLLRQYVGRTVPIESARVTVDAPTKLGARVAARGYRSAAPKKQVRGGRTVWTYDLGRLAPEPTELTGVPGDVAGFGYIAVATAPSWAAVAAGYDHLIAARLAEPFTAPAGLTGATPRATVDLALAWLHANVRDNGIGLIDSAIVPSPPAQTVARGAGDAQDRATLLVALLRAAKLEANLVLLESGPGGDLDRDLPGMGIFDHVIVRVRIDGKDLWIDPTEAGLPAGQLPAHTQGRLALIVAPGTRDLVTTPMAAPAENLVREVRTYHLAELEKARVTEVTREAGVFSDHLRGWVRDSDRTDVSKYLNEYTGRQYHGQMVRFAAPMPAKVTDPFDLTLEIADAANAYTGREQIDVYLYPTDTLGRVGEILTDAGATIGAEVDKRTMDYAWAAPHVYEIENRLVLPPGYEAPALVARDQRTLGAMTLTTTRRVDGRAVVITYRLDSGKARITAAQLRATRAAVKTLQDEDGEHVVIAQTGAALMQQGKLPEAIKEYRRLIALHPKEALHHDQLAEAYRRAGMAPAARRAARKAVATEPSSGDAHAQLAYHLMHDSTGRELGIDSDRAGAIAAYRKALELTPTHIGALQGLGALLGRDARGWQSTSADQREAAGIFWRAHEAGSTDDEMLHAAECLLRAGDFAAAEAVARSLPASDTHSELLVAAVAAGRGGREAVALAATLATGDARASILTSARGWMYSLRRYDTMRELHAEVTATDPTADPTLDVLMKTIVAVDLDKQTPSDPTTPARLLIASLVGMPLPTTPWSKAMDQDLNAMSIDTSRAMYDSRFSELSLPVAIDTVLAPVRADVEGNATTGWRVDLEIHAGRLVLYVVKGAGGAELVAVGGMPDGFGRQIQAALARKDMAEAARWLDRLGNGAAGHAAIDAVRQLVKAEVPVGKPPSRTVLELAAALLFATTDPAAAIPVLRRCNVTHAPTQDFCRVRLVEALRKRKAWDDIPAVARQIPVTSSFEIMMRARHLALGDAGAEAVSLVDDALVRSPDDEVLLMSRALLAVEVEGWTAAQPWIAKVVAHAAVTKTDLNNLAWTRLFHDPSPDQARALAQRAELLGGTMSPYLAHTLASIEAESDNPHQAMQYLAKSHRRLPWEPPPSSDWYVIGRVAESYGLRDDAIAAYRKVEPDDPSPGQPTTYDFARRALGRLGVK